MLPDRVSNPGPLTYESGALPIALRGPAVRLLVVLIDRVRFPFSTNQCDVLSAETFTNTDQFYFATS